MDDEDPTTVIKMLNDLTSKTESYRRSSNVSLRISGAGMNPPITLGLDSDRRLSTSSTKIKRTSEISGNRLSDSLSTNSSYSNDEITPKRAKFAEVRESTSLLNSTDVETLPSSPWEWRRLRGEIVSLRTRLSHQEATVQQLHKIRREMEEIFQRDKKMLEMQAESDKQTIKQLELRVESARRNTQEAREAKSLVENEMFEMKVKLEQKISTLLNENAKLLENIRNTNVTESVNPPPPCNHDQDTDAQSKSEALQKRILELEQKLKESRVTQQDFEFQNVELQNARIKIEKLESERALWEEGKSLLSRAARASELEKELTAAKEMIAAMRETVKGKLLIEEQMSNMQLRLEHTEKIEQQVANLEVKCRELMGKLAEYEGIGIGDSPTALRKEIQRLQQAEAVLTAEEGQLRSKVDSLQRENQGLERNFEEAKRLANELTTSTERLNQLVRRLQKKVLLITRERDSYRQQLDLYEKEMTTVESNNAAAERIPALERALEDYRELVAKLEADLTIPDVISWRDECQRLRGEVDRLKGELEHRALKGDFNCDARILHFKMNPAAIATQQAEEKYKALLQEVEELRAAVQLGNFSSSVGSSSLHAQEIAELKQTHEIKIARLKEAFKASSQEYRQACYQLFGWRIDRTKEGRYKLSSQYAESPDDFLFFHVGEGVDLLETPFSATLGSLIERHLQMQHSVPMFLNAVQSDLFSQQTMTTVLSTT